MIWCSRANLWLYTTFPRCFLLTVFSMYMKTYIDNCWLSIHHKGGGGGGALLAPGATLSKGFNLGNGRKIEPSIGVEGTWEFDLFGRPPLNAGQVNSSTNNGQVDVTVSGGLTLDLARAVKLKLNGSAGGLARSKYRELSGGGQISVQFWCHRLQSARTFWCSECSTKLNDAAAN